MRPHQKFIALRMSEGSANLNFLQGVSVKLQIRALFSTAFIVIALGACSAMSDKGAAPMAAKQVSLFDHLGGKPAIIAVVDERR